MEFTPWTLLIDVGLAALLLLAGQIARARLRPVQQLFLPASVIAGVLGLSLGTGGLGWLPFSGYVGAYPGILIALIFVTLPFAAAPAARRTVGRNVVELFAYSTLTSMLQWGVGLAFALGALSLIWTDLHPGFGTILAAGFIGGHGTAAVVGTTYAQLGWPAAGPLAMTAATVGIVAAIVGGMAWIKWGVQKGAARLVAPFDELPGSLRTGLLPDDEQRPLGQETVAANTIDPLAMHLALVGAVVLAGYWIAQGTGQWLGHFRLPTFVGAFLLAVACRVLLRKTGALRYVDRRTMVRLGGTCTDFLVVYGIASIDLAILLEYAYPLAALTVCGIAINTLLFFLWGPRAFGEYWFEKSLYTWGWVNGVMAMAIALLRIVDAEGESHLLDDFAVAYVGFGPIEVALVALVPILVTQGQGWLLAAAALTVAAVIFVLIPRIVRRGVG